MDFTIHSRKISGRIKMDQRIVEAPSPHFDQSKEKMTPVLPCQVPEENHRRSFQSFGKTPGPHRESGKGKFGKNHQISPGSCIFNQVTDLQHILGFIFPNRIILKDYHPHQTLLLFISTGKFACRRKP
jgi:hypothetical protein